MIADILLLIYSAEFSYFYGIKRRWGSVALNVTIFLVWMFLYIRDLQLHRLWW